MTFQYLAGTYADRIFANIGLNFTTVRYRGMTFSPNPIVSHEGTAPQSEFRSDLSPSEAVDTYTVSFPADALRSQLASAFQAEKIIIDQRFDAGIYDANERGAQMAIIERDYRLEYAIAAYREWQLSLDKGATFKKFHTQGDPRREAVRWVIKLVSLGGVTYPGLSPTRR